MVTVLLVFDTTEGARDHPFSHVDPQPSYIRFLEKVFLNLEPEVQAESLANAFRRRLS